VRGAHAKRQPQRNDDDPERAGGNERSLVEAEVPENDENAGDQRRIPPGGGARKTAQPRPFESAAGDQRSDEQAQEAGREEKQRPDQRRDQYRGRAEARRQYAAQATSARPASATCSLVRPKRRSRLR